MEPYPRADLHSLEVETPDSLTQLPRGVSVSLYLRPAP